jgi:hypothetical protein
MRNLTEKTFILTINNEIDAIAKSWDDMRDYCSETGKRGDVYVLENMIPLGGKIENISPAQVKFFGSI